VYIAPQLFKILQGIEVDRLCLALSYVLIISLLKAIVNIQYRQKARYIFVYFVAF